MTKPVIVEIERHFPPGFFVSANKNNNNISLSESFGRAILVVATKIDENIIKRGDPHNHEPDFILNNNSGFEITFASNREGKSESNILRLKKDGYEIRGMEMDLIKSISDSINEKSDKKKNGNYKNVEGVSVVVICLDPLLYWYGYLHNFNHPHTLKLRDDFFTSLYNEYIASSIFKYIYIYILQLTEFQTTILFDIKAFQTNPNECITEISSKNLDKLPHCFVTNGTMTSSDSAINGSSHIIYRFHDVFLKRNKSS